MKTVVFLLTLVSSHAFAQAFGSIESYRADAAMRAASRKADYDWINDKRISLLPSQELLEPMPNECLLLSKAEPGNKGRVGGYRFKVLSIADAENVLLTYGDASLLWLTGYPTENLLTDQIVRIVDLVEVVSPKTYTTAAGTERTVRAIALAPKEETKKLFAADVEKLAEEKKFRTWTAKNGNEIHAKFVRYRSGKVTFEKSNGDTVDVTLTLLVPEDIKEIRELDKQQKSTDK
jgi:mRNA-degrading endonuclease RelE of RelBE toxin-antitoxin system